MNRPVTIRRQGPPAKQTRAFPSGAWVCATLAALVLAFGWSSATCAAAEEKPPADAELSAAARAERVVERMQSAREKLSQREAGPATQEIQQSILNDLDALLKTPPSQSPSQNSGGSQSGQSGSSGGRSASRSQTPSASDADPSPAASARDPANSQPSAAERERPVAEDSTERTGPARAAELAAARRRRLEVDVWGHLPEQIREQLLNTYGEKMVPQYEDLVRKFYEALSEPPNRTGSKR
jgi:hypothetical protein